MKMLSSIRFWILFATFVGGIVAVAAKLKGGESFLFPSFNNNKEDTLGNDIGSELVRLSRSNSIIPDDGERNEEPPASPEFVVDVHSIFANPPSSPSPPPPQQTPSLTTDSISKIRAVVESLILEIESIQAPSSSSDQQPPPLRQRLVSWFTENRNAIIISCTVDWVRQKRGLEVLDPTLLSRPESEIEEMTRALAIALLCVNLSPHERPTMRDIAAMLKEIKNEREEYAKFDVLLKGSPANEAKVLATSSSASAMQSFNKSNNTSFSVSSLLHSSSSSKMSFK